jgi:homogentisate phytyltransferase/homogentisate geranylgeranyltransferase
MFDKVIFWLSSLWKFSRPHTIIGTSLSVFSLYFLAIATTNTQITKANLILMLGVWLSCLLGNLYIVGLNQLVDVNIDQINKPDLPLAAGDFSLKQGQWIVVISGLLALILSAYLGLWLFITVIISLLIGTAYSLPPIRIKRFPLPAALCIFTVRGIVVNLGLFLHFTQKLTGKELLNSSVWLLSLFIIVFTIAIAIFKDVPDIEGDQKYQITTFTILLGKATVFKIIRWVITISYLGLIVGAFLFDSLVNYWFLLTTHLGLLGLLWLRSQRVNLEQKVEITSFYQFIWKLFFLEYLLFSTAYFI